ncbi:MAG: DUF5752 family protein [Candidatus Woesearchaeota archaeon]
MALFKNLYLDLSYLNPFSYFKKNNKSDKIQYNDVSKNQVYSSEAYSNNFNNLKLDDNMLIDSQINTISNEENEKTENLELPDVSKKLLSEKNETEKKLPKINIVMPPPLINNSDSQTANKNLDGKNILLNDKLIIASSKQLEDKSYLNQIEKNDNQSILEDSSLSHSYSHSYFNDIFHQLNSNQINKTLSNKIYNPNLLEEMQTFWKLKKEEINQIKFNSTVKTELLKKLTELQKLETEWQNLQLQSEKINDLLFSKEILIENQVKQIKKLFKKLHLTVNAPLNQEFILSNGNRIYNLNELINILKNIEDNIFFYHVNDNKNDFYNWIRDVFGFNELADQIKNIKDKNQMADIIEKWANHI